MSDLIERLRQVDPPGGDDHSTRWYRNPDGPEAADRIEALEAELAETSRILDEALATIKSTPTMDEMIDRMHEVQDAWKAKYAALKALVPDPDDLRSAIEALVDAIRDDLPSAFSRRRATLARLRATLPTTKGEDDGE